MKRFPTNEANEQELLRLSAETLTIVMNSVNHANVLGKYNCDLPWTVGFFRNDARGRLYLTDQSNSLQSSPYQRRAFWHSNSFARVKDLVHTGPVPASIGLPSSKASVIS